MSSEMFERSITRSSISDMWARTMTPHRVIEEDTAPEALQASVPPRPKELLMLELSHGASDVVVWDAEAQTFGLARHQASFRLAREASGRSVLGGVVPSGGGSEGKVAAEPDPNQFTLDDMSFAAAMAEQLENATVKQERKSKIQLHFQRVVHVLSGAKINTIPQLRATMIRYCKIHVHKYSLTSSQRGTHAPLVR